MPSNVESSLDFYVASKCPFDLALCNFALCIAAVCCSTLCTTCVTKLKSLLMPPNHIPYHPTNP